jgi:hypothetical protein
LRGCVPPAAGEGIPARPAISAGLDHEVVEAALDGIIDGWRAS